MIADICYVYDGLNPVARRICANSSPVQEPIDYLLGVGLDELSDQQRGRQRFVFARRAQFDPGRDQRQRRHP